MSLGFDIHPVESVSAPGYDALLVISHNAAKDESIPAPLKDAIKEASALDAHFEEAVSIIKIDLPAKRLVYIPTGPINSEHDDVRSFSEAAKKGIQRALKAGVKAPLLVLGKYNDFPHSQLVALLGILDGVYTTLQYREACPHKHPKLKSLGVLASGPNASRLITVASALETGRILARDIGTTDPERMTPIKVEEHLRKAFPPGGNVKMEVISDESTIGKDYPLFAAVNRAASVIDRHKGRIIYLTYEGSNVTDTLLFVGKGVTYDSGGADIKISGGMVGMSKDKCGAAAVAGFMKVLSILKPENLKVVAGLGMIRNSVGENSYVADEIITSRAGKRIRVVNTDAEGRMVMADILCYLKDVAKQCVNPHLFTVATLTGHAFKTVGVGYTVAMDNGPARVKSFAYHLQKSGELIGDMFEVSQIRREDYETFKGKHEGEDVIQSDNKPSNQVSRGHQGAAAFLVLASGLDKHGIGTEQPLRFTHLDIAASSGMWGSDVATGAPILGVSTHFLNLKDEDF